MKVSEVMTRDVLVITPQETIQRAAQHMAETGCGALPIEENQHLVGMVTDRDIVLRALAHGMSHDTPVREIMSTGVKYCFDDEELGQIGRNMADIQVKRLAVLNREKRLVGIVSLGDLANSEDAEAASMALSGISEPCEAHVSQGSRPGK
ncbi:MAG: CBS domain-containing protein [Paludibacterium sp.]|uniref:CBS domain-containing protein n=1 Tax=Paludibacterium sp. TaxID=1917523 RepID=UPI0025CD7923|nr:CBS domain-containing protein [Paludibacterium sp.]MBV8048407.1 CBS domain-containing protein [Paludibacterium sp.]MBV8646893.1 CBS domain-containing protein [Paludibacterium sp.]